MTFKFRFAGPCREKPTELNDQELRRAAQCMGGKAGTSCSVELFFGFFFDGTRNNMYVSEKNQDSSHTNVARLWEVFNDEVEPAYSARRHRFRTYVEGVGTPCQTKVGDSGVGAHAQAGAAEGWGGEARLNWALLEFQNNLCEHFTSRSLTVAMGDKSVDLVKQMSADLALSRMDLTEISEAAKIPLGAYVDMEPGDTNDVHVRRAQNFVDSFLRLREIHNQDPRDAERRRILARRNEALRQMLGPHLAAKPTVSQIRLSVFGFSRGAAAARVFVNWLKDACDPPSGYSFYNSRGDGRLLLAGIPVVVDFLGLFDTVASAGLAQGIHVSLWDGHGAWARKKDMEIPLHVSRCVHMVSAHEVRGSFPVDLIHGAGYQEIVYPGVHSDIGGGYKPLEQGRSKEDADKLSQIPLCHMYREAVQAGVPLRLDSPSLAAEVKRRFDVSEKLRTAFNAYVEATADISTGQASTAHILYGHYIQYLRWRRLRAEEGPEWLGNTEASIEARKNNPQDYEDLIQANRELLEEVRTLTVDNSYRRIFHRPRFFGMSSTSNLYDSAMLFMRGQKEEAWVKQIEGIWNLPGRPAPAVIKLLDDFVHDSRAWFKPLGKDDDVWQAIQRDNMEKLATKQSLALHYEADGRSGMADGVAITQAEEEALARYQANPQDLPLQLAGREFFWQWGYLRWRSTFQNLQVSQQREAEQDRKDTQQFLQNSVDINKIFNMRF